MDALTILQVGPLLARFRERVEAGDVGFEESVKTLASASELILFKVRWLMPNARVEEAENEVLGNDGEDQVEEEICASSAPVMDPDELALAVRLLDEGMRRSASEFSRGYVRPIPGGGLRPVVTIDVADLKEAATEVEGRSQPRQRTLILPRQNFVTHLRNFWREVRRLAARGGAVRFSRFLGKTKQEAILNFLAFLELVKRRRLRARQLSLFGDIEFSTVREMSVGGERRSQ